MIDLSWTDADGVKYDGQYTVTATGTGPICGSCHERHTNVAGIRACYRLAAEMQADMEAEIAADRAAERYYEDRGYDDARRQDEYEARMGVIPFDVAMAAANGDMDLADYLMPAPIAY